MAALLEADLFTSGVRPAINVGNSVSRLAVGANQGHETGCRDVAPGSGAISRSLVPSPPIRLGSGQATQAQLNRGQRLTSC